MSYREDFNQVQSNAYWSARRVLLAVLFLMFAFGVIGFISQGTNFFMYKFFAPRQEAVRRQK